MNSEQQAKAPRRDLQGPRPAPLKICRDSHNIRKPQVPLPAMQYRKPVIIYTHSPKVIHTEAREFMTLVQRLTGRVKCDADSRPDSCMSSSSSASSSIQSQTTHALPPPCHASGVPGNPNCYRVDASPTSSLPGNPNCYRVDAASPRPEGGLDVMVKEDKSIDMGSNPSDFSGNSRSTVQSLLSPTIQSSSIFPLSPSFFLPSTGLLSPHIFQDFPMYTTQPDYFYSPRHMLCMQPEPNLTPSGRPVMNALSSLSSPSPTGCDPNN